MSYKDLLPDGTPIIADMMETEGTLDYDPVKITVSPEYLEIKRANEETSPTSSLWIKISDIIAVRIDEDAYIPTQQLYCLDRGEEDDAVANGMNGNGVTGGELKGLTFHAYDMTGLPTQLVDMFAVKQVPGHLRLKGKDGKVGLYVVISTMSGTQQATSLYEKAVKPLLEELGVKGYEVHKTESEHTIEQLTKSTIIPRAKEGWEQTVVLLSGDGGPVDLINAMLSEELKAETVKPTVALLPMGTGNALAHSSGLTKDDTFGLRSLCRGTAEGVPCFRVTMSKGAKFVVDEGRERKDVTGAGGKAEIYGAVVFSWGLHASLVAASDTAEYRKHGVERFKMAAQELLAPKDGSESHRYHGRISVRRGGSGGFRDFETMERKEHMYILATMVSNLEEHFCISPASKPLDGQMRLVSFGVMDAGQVMKILGSAYEGGKHVEDEAVRYEAIEGLRIDFEEEEEKWRQVCVDGKIIAVEKGGWVEVRKDNRQVVSLVVP
jgi:diacylglycerol kinase family enzyme